MSGIQCAECGRFLGEADFAAGRVYYEPESEFGHERIEWACRRHGFPTRAAQRIEAQSDETPEEAVQPEGREPGPKDAPEPLGRR